MTAKRGWWGGNILNDEQELTKHIDIRLSTFVSRAVRVKFNDFKDKKKNVKSSREKKVDTKKYRRGWNQTCQHLSWRQELKRATQHVETLHFKFNFDIYL